jgi:hypothetical protein
MKAEDEDGNNRKMAYDLRYQSNSVVFSCPNATFPFRGGSSIGLQMWLAIRLILNFDGSDHQWVSEFVKQY